MRFLLPLLLLWNLAYTQSGKYTIEQIDKHKAEGYVLISQHYIEADSIKFQVVDVYKENQTTNYFLEGCVDGLSYRGLARLSNTLTTKLGENRFRQHCLLVLEIRTKEGYYVTKYGLYYDY